MSRLPEQVYLKTASAGRLCARIAAKQNALLYLRVASSRVCHEVRRHTGSVFDDAWPQSEESWREEAMVRVARWCRLVTRLNKFMQKLRIIDRRTDDRFKAQVQVAMDQIARGEFIEEEEMDARVERMLQS